VFLLGVLAKSDCKTWFFAGEFVVSWCQIVVRLMVFFGRGKSATFLKFIF
jgi:hypothetical protein